MDPPARRVVRSRRLRAWRWVAVVAVVAVAGAVLAVALRHGDEPDDGLAPCRTVLAAVRAEGEGKAKQTALLDVVTEQLPLARAEADRKPTLASVADAMEQMRVDLAAGRPSRSVVVLYGQCD